MLMTMGMTTTVTAGLTLTSDDQGGGQGGRDCLAEIIAPPYMPARIPAHIPPRLGRPRRVDDRPHAAARGYCSKAHRAWRQAVLARDAWTCRACGRVCSGYREAHADHVVSIAQGGARYDLANGQTLCVACHAKKTFAENRCSAAQKSVSAIKK